VGDISNYAETFWRTLVETWNGAMWTISASPNEGPKNNIENFLQSVSCSSAAFCVAVGDYASASDYLQTMVESWSGSAWSVVANPDPSDENSSFHGVSCTNATGCVAVGSSDSGTLIDTWGGRVWTTTVSPNTVGGHLYGVSCMSPSGCAAVGYFDSGPTTTRPLIETGPA
jgi:hypothetical protein